MKRHVILHFHTYKNAGSSVDSFLQSLFSGAWAEFDLHAVGSFFLHHSELVLIAGSRPHLKAISSHQIRLPVPVPAAIEFLPIVFIRHPILRAASLWRFERTRKDSHKNTLLARKFNFAEWLEYAFKTELHRNFCDGQSWLFSFGFDQRIRRSDPTIARRAAENLAGLPSIGVVEQFDRSMNVFEKLYQPKVTEFVYTGAPRVNATNESEQSVDDQLSIVRCEIGQDLFDELVCRNQSDLALYDEAVKRLAAHD